MGWLVSISGIDGSGKTTLVDSLKERFDHSGISVKSIRVKLGFTPFVDWIKKVLGVRSEASSSECSPPDLSRFKMIPEKIIWKTYCLISLTELIFLFAWISIQRSVGRQIITDRYLWDNEIIYRNKYGHPAGLIKILWGIARAVARLPDAALLLNIPPEESYRRILIRNAGKEEEELKVLNLRAQMYAELDQPGFVKIDALSSPEKVVNLACQVLEDRGLVKKISGQISETGEQMDFPPSLQGD